MSHPCVPSDVSLLCLNSPGLGQSWGFTLEWCHIDMDLGQVPSDVWCTYRQLKRKLASVFWFCLVLFFLLKIRPTPERGSHSWNVPLHPNVQPISERWPEALSLSLVPLLFCHPISFFVDLSDDELFYHRLSVDIGGHEDFNLLPGDVKDLMSSGPLWVVSDAARPECMSVFLRLGVVVSWKWTTKTVFNDDHSGCCVFVAVMSYLYNAEV